MLHGHYIHVKDPAFDSDMTEIVPAISPDDQGDEEPQRPLPKGNFKVKFTTLFFVCLKISVL